MQEHSPTGSGHRFALLYQLSQTFNSSLDITAVLDTVMDEVLKNLKAERGFIALRDDSGDMAFRSARGIDQTTIDHPEFEISRGVVERVFQAGEGLRVSDAQMDDRFSSRQSVVNLKLRSILCVPLKLKGSVLGVIYVDNRIAAGIFTENDMELLTAISSSAVIAIENARLYEVAVEKGRMEREMQMAFQVQSSLIPDKIPIYTGWDFAACWRPARQVSGDFYDFVSMDNGLLNCVIADVTDKGMPAALFMALTRSIVRANFDQNSTLAAGIAQANRLICADSSLNMPVTLFCCQLDLATGNLTYVNAGHNPPIMYSLEENAYSELRPTGMVLGFDEEARFEQRSVTLAIGDFVVCYTDGVLDAINAQEEAYEIERLQKVIQDNRKVTASELVEAIESSVLQFAGDRPLYDDLTMLVIRRREDKP